MNRERAKELLPIMQAFIDGEIVQWRSLPAYPEWQSTADPFWCDDDHQHKNEWRVKPAPREFFIMQISANTYTAYRRDQLGPDPEDDNSFIHVYEALNNE